MTTQRLYAATPPARLPEMEEWLFNVAAAPATVWQYYDAQLTPQGWTNAGQGTFTEARACPKLTLEVRATSQQGSEWNYRATLRQEACNTYC